MTNLGAKNKLSSLLGDYGNNSDSELDDSLNPTNGASMTGDGVYETDWTQCIDTNTGHPYYWNIVSKDVTWEMPVEYSRFIQHNTAKYGNVSTTDKWVFAGDDQQSYYFNTITREISWEKPAGYVETVTESKPKAVSKSKRSHRDDKRKPTPKKYPFPELEIEKIELITSYDAASDKSTDDNESNGAASVKRKRKETVLNLVADYSDNSDDEEAPKSAETKTTKPLFAAAVAATETPSSDAYSLTVKSILRSTINDAQSTGSAILECRDSVGAAPMQPPKSKPNTFASIITGGRSPTNDPSRYIEAELPASDSSDINETRNIIETEIISTKMLKRKRRIEFNTTRPVVATIAPAMVDANDAGAGDNGKCDETPDACDIDNNVMYAGFPKAETEYANKSNGGSGDEAGADDSDDEDVKSIQLKLDIQHLKDVLRAKVKFLCQDRADVPPVQIIQIQLEMLLAAYDADALNADYLLKWLNSVATDLVRLEQDAAPDGWKCFWDRSKSRYGYENLATGDIEWDYPVTESMPPLPVAPAQKPEAADDEMDICTTPPPNELPEMQPVGASMPPAPPSWNAAKTALIQTHLISGEPLPPGIDIVGYKDVPPDDINQELASFYSDLATMDVTPAIPAAAEVAPAGADPSPENVADGDEISDSKKKKKKKKAKKLEPWRSGNLETWINKWQAAQKELDG